MTKEQERAIRAIAEGLLSSVEKGGMVGANAAWQYCLGLIDEVVDGALWALALAMVLVIKSEEPDLYYQRRIAASVLADLLISRNVAIVEEIVSQVANHPDESIRTLLAQPKLFPRDQVEGVAYILLLLDPGYELAKRGQVRK